MLLKAMGFSYEEIAQRTGLQLHEGQSLLDGGAPDLPRPIRSHQCRRRLRRVAAPAVRGQRRRVPGRGPVSALQSHLAACAPCRATLRTYRQAPARLAELLPPAVLLPVLERAGWWARLTGWLDAGPAERAASLAQKLHGNAEMLSAKKAAVVMASTAALAGGPLSRRA